MSKPLAPGFYQRIESISFDRLSREDLDRTLDLCKRAFSEDLRDLFAVYNRPNHLIIRSDDAIIGHACLIERWMQSGGSPLMRTAFVEAVAVDPACQGKGMGLALMKRVMVDAEQQGYDIGGLSTGHLDFYRKLGWELWMGPQEYRKDGQTFAMPDERGAMIYRLSRTPQLDLNLPVSIEWRPGEEIW